jgi:asparagine synthase (glutamine-hydrolysing)
MFAFALWDSKNEILFCARDRFGKKPFYYYFTDNEFIFCSEIKPILNFPSVKKEYNEKALIEYILYSLQDHSQETFFKYIFQLEQGSYALINRKEGKIEKKASKYYDIVQQNNYQENSPNEFLSLLRESVRIRLRSDVPLGILLSGGLDSAAITQVVNDLAVNRNDIKLFTAASHEKDIDESYYASIIAKIFGFEHQIVYPDGTQLLKDLSKITLFHEKPIAGTSIFSHYNIMKEIQRFNVKVILQGQGSDELLAGYDNFYNPYLAQSIREFKLLNYLIQLKRCANKSDLSVKKLFFSSLNKAIYKPFTIKRKFNSRLINSSLNEKLKDYKMYKLEKFSDNVFTNDLYNYMKVNNLPYILHYEDRNSMMFSIESRTPFLDYRLVDYCFNLPAQYKIKKGERKVILKQAMRSKLPDSIIDRQKRGFPTPTRKWLVEDSRAGILEIFNSDKFKSNPFFDQKNVMHIYEKYCYGDKKYEQDIWKVLAIYTWYELFF